ncbi:MAG: flippase-like domain-containing protein, partial [Actinomycetota bacterium]|nr:flippase-like domain-containing protein [Actinomycetota bacterium]
ARVAVWALVAYFLARVLIDAAGAVREAQVAFLLLPLLLSTVIDLVARAAWVLGWQTLLTGSAVRIPVHRSARIYASSELVRYLPGGVLHLAARYRMAAREGVPPNVIVTSTILDLGLRVVTGALLFLAIMPAWDSRPGRLPVVLAALIPAAIVALHPRTLALGIRLSRRVLGRGEAATPDVRHRALVGAAGWYAAGWLARGSAFYILATAITPTPMRLLLPFIGVYALSWVVGVLVIFAPSGLGVREAAGVALLRHLIGGPVAAVILVVSRLQSIVVEIVFAWIVLAWDRLRSRPRTGEPVR